MNVPILLITLDFSTIICILLNESIKICTFVKNFYILLQLKQIQVNVLYFIYI